MEEERDREGRQERERDTKRWEDMESERGERQGWREWKVNKT